MRSARRGRRIAAGTIVAAGLWLGLPAASASAAPAAATGECSFVFPPLPGCHDQDAFTGWGFDGH
ncbi:hypothetical protein EDD29_6405 [Actinocorallia herbida]|uniref:Uncharacterized protein n=1 Tax=Actinocorallia herbida TaxID=58109 RepID=A0A3N1D5I7_9ACTN|nr:hypothetical protein [Actinocorallia herbida]ROO88726.1 hypothetical protein EDD29_6405 [Actinocorallia herbida]